MKKFLVVLAIVVAGLAGWYAWKSRESAPREESEDEPVAAVTTTIVKEREIVRSLEVFGVVAPASSSEHTIVAPYDCLIRRVNVSAGAQVAIEEVLLEIGPSPDTKLALDSARGALGLAESSLAAMQERYDLKLATSEDLLTARQAAADAKLKVASLEERGEGGGGLMRARAAGTITRLDLAEGALVAAGTPLVTIASATGLEARLGIEANHLGDVRLGQKIMLRPTGREPAHKIESNLGAIGGIFDAATGTVEARAPVPAEAQLLPGEHVAAVVELEKHSATLVVPRSAVLTDKGKSFLFVVANQHALKREVRVGITTDTEVEVAGQGLQPGDAVVVQGNYELEDGMAVQVSAHAEDESAGRTQEPQR